MVSESSIVFASFASLLLFEIREVEFIFLNVKGFADALAVIVVMTSIKGYQHCEGPFIRKGGEQATLKVCTSSACHKPKHSNDCPLP